MRYSVTDGVRAYQELYRQIKEKYKIHHVAMAGGYLSRNLRYIESYEGVFGKGYVVHIPTRECAFEPGKSKNMHKVEYWIE